MDKKMKKAMDKEDKKYEVLSVDPDAREILAPYAGHKVIVAGRIERLSISRGANPVPTALLKDITVFIDDKELSLSYAWLITTKFDAETDYLFSATISEYPKFDDNKNAFTKYGFFKIKRTIKHKGDVSAALKMLRLAEEGDKKALEGGNHYSVGVIQEMLEMYGFAITPMITPEGKWTCSIVKPECGESIEISKEKTFAKAVMHARDIISFLCDIKIKTTKEE